MAENGNTCTIYAYLSPTPGFFAPFCYGRGALQGHLQGGGIAAASPMSFSPGAIEGLTFVSATGTAQFTGVVLARGGRDAELQSKGKHGGNSLRLELGSENRQMPCVCVTLFYYVNMNVEGQRENFFGQTL